jgi:hypothetical protein
MSERYILDDDGNPVPEPDLYRWGEWMQDARGDRRRVARDEIGDAVVSTVFLGLDHSFGSGPPLIYETMIFSGKHNDYQERYSTRDEALAGHYRAVSLVSTDA